MYQVGNPAIFDGNRFFPETGSPMRNSASSSIKFADCEPVPFVVATLIVKSLTTFFIDDLPVRAGTPARRDAGRRCRPTFASRS